MLDIDRENGLDRRDRRNHARLRRVRRLGMPRAFGVEPFEQEKRTCGGANNASRDTLLNRRKGGDRLWGDGDEKERFFLAV